MSFIAGILIGLYTILLPVLADAIRVKLQPLATSRLFRTIYTFLCIPISYIFFTILLRNLGLRELLYNPEVYMYVPLGIGLVFLMLSMLLFTNILKPVYDLFSQTLLTIYVGILIVTNIIVYILSIVLAILSLGLNFMFAVILGIIAQMFITVFITILATMKHYSLIYALTGLGYVLHYYSLNLGKANLPKHIAGLLGHFVATSISPILVILTVALIVYTSYCIAKDIAELGSFVLRRVKLVTLVVAIAESLIIMIPMTLSLVPVTPWT